jgi:hypothetical protein
MESPKQSFTASIDAGIRSSDQLIKPKATAPVTFYYDSNLDKVVWKKLDLYVLPVVAMFYLLSFLVGRSANSLIRGTKYTAPLDRTAPTLAMHGSLAYKRNSRCQMNNIVSH